MGSFDTAAIGQNVLTATFKTSLSNMPELFPVHLIMVGSAQRLGGKANSELTCIAAADHTVPFSDHFSNAASSFCSCSSLLQYSAPDPFTECFFRIAFVMSAVMAARYMFFCEFRMTAMYLVDSRHS